MSTPVHGAIAKRFPSPEWATFFEVRDAAGFSARRSADVVAMNTWPSRGLAVHGVEVKVSRSDWLRELKDPAKSASVQRFCDRWWLATSDDKVAKIEEVPEAWGLLVLRGKALVQVKEAPALTAEPLTRGFVAMLLRNATAGIIQQRMGKRTEREGDVANAVAERAVTSLKALQDRVSAFEAASGINLADRWGELRDPQKLGEALRALLALGSPYGLDKLEHAKREADRMSSQLATAIEVVRALGHDQQPQLEKGQAKP
jgi:hypothetical protein